MSDIYLEWKYQAACLDSDPEWFFERRYYGKGLAVCKSCTVRNECLALADRAEQDLVADKIYGIFGGMTPIMRLVRRYGDSPEVKRITENILPDYPPGEILPHRRHLATQYKTFNLYIDLALYQLKSQQHVKTVGNARIRCLPPDDNDPPALPAPDESTPVSFPAPLAPILSVAEG